MTQRRGSSELHSEMQRATQALARGDAQLRQATALVERAREELHGGGGSAAVDSRARFACDSVPGLLGSRSRPWLLIGINTVPRPGKVSYLNQTLSSLLDELPDSPSDPLGPSAVRIVVMNMVPGGHEAFEEAKAAFTGANHAKGNAYLTFLDRPGQYIDPRPGAPPVDDLHNPKNIPGAQVRRQTCDVATLLEYAAGTLDGEDGASPLAEHFMFLEDDFDTCGHAVRVLQYALQKLSLRAPSWLALRVSYGMNGIILRAGKDAAQLAAYLRLHAARLPPDLLWQEWALAGGSRERGGDASGEVKPRRLLYVFRQNLFAHTGDVSSFAVRPSRRAWPGCYAPMSSVWSLHKREQFDRDRCDQEDLSPCDGAALDGSVTADWATRLPLFGVADDGAQP